VRGERLEDFVDEAFSQKGSEKMEVLGLLRRREVHGRQNRKFPGPTTGEERKGHEKKYRSHKDRLHQLARGGKKGRKVDSGEHHPWCH